MLFDFDLPIRDLAISDEEADKVVTVRLRRLGIYTIAGIPQNLRDKFEAGRSLTQGCHENCKILIDFARSNRVINEYNDARIAKIAFQKLILNLSDAAGSVGLHFAQFETCDLLAEKLGTHQHSNIREILTEHFSERDPFHLTIALTTGALFKATFDQVKFSCELLLSICLFAMIYRGIFYVSIVKERGSKLEAVESRAKLERALEELPWQLMGKIPMAGELFTTLRDIGKYILTIYDKEAALEEAAEDLARRNQAAEDFIDEYNKALLLWAQKANGLSSIIVENHKIRQEIFSFDF